MSASDSYRVGIDVGGTFTDLFLWTSAGRVHTHKVLSTPRDPSIGVLDGLAGLAAALKLDPSEFAGRIDTIVHGTTVTTNATLTRGGAKVGLITTEGVRDALEMRRGVREEQYDNRYQNVVPIVPRYLRRGVKGRLDYAGRELWPLESEDVREACALFGAEGVEAVAICFMNAFADPIHERAAAAVVREALPGVYLTASSDVLPTIRFYNRVSTTVLNAYVGPVLRDYIASLQQRLSDVGFGGVLLIMQSSGGVGLPELVLDRPSTTLLSGPAAGPAGALSFTEAGGGGTSCLVCDMGGTSFDASLVRDGRVALKAEGDIDRLRIALPMLEIVTIGAGGGSIGRIDRGGLLRMGPESAGAEPGPACYGRGGDKPTCTDANLVLGYLDPAFFAGGALPLRPDLSREAVAAHVAAPLGASVEDAAAGMYRVISANMAHGVREITVKRGLDPREFPMVVAGGAGALHACAIAAELEIPQVIVPAGASILCAVGMLMSDLQHDFVRSYVSRLSELELERLDGLGADMVAAGEALLEREGVPSERREHVISLDLRYVKQYHEVTVDVGPMTRVGPAELLAFVERFHAEHDRLYGYNLAEQGTELELINVRVRSIGRTRKPTHPRIERGGPDPAAALKGHRRAFVPESGDFADVPVYDGAGLLANNRICGPALIEHRDMTVLVSAAYAARIDDYGSAWIAPVGGEA